jgi:hypothetical protein
MSVNRRPDTWTRRICALIVALVAAYASYEHQRHFALNGGADPTSSSLWPLSVDGLLVLATASLLKPAHDVTHRVRTAVWTAFLLGIAVSLAANIASAPTFDWQPILVAGWPPIALLLAVELLAHQPKPQPDAGPTSGSGDEPLTDTEVIVTLANPPAPEPATAAEVMWAHYQREATRGRTPTGAELDRVAGTNNYGRTILRKWRQTGRLEHWHDKRATNRTRSWGQGDLPSSCAQKHDVEVGVGLAATCSASVRPAG